MTDPLLDDVGVAVTRFGRLALPVHQSEPLRMVLEILVVVKAEPGMADLDGGRPAHSVVMVPFLKVLGTRRVGAVAVPDVAGDREAGALPLVEADRNGLLLGNDFPDGTREEPAATQLVQKRGHRMLHASRFPGDQQHT
jgi:hypothetical protein